MTSLFGSSDLDQYITDARQYMPDTRHPYLDKQENSGNVVRNNINKARHETLKRKGNLTPEEEIEFENLTNQIFGLAMEVSTQEDIPPISPSITSQPAQRVFQPHSIPMESSDTILVNLAKMRKNKEYALYINAVVQKELLLMEEEELLASVEDENLEQETLEKIAKILLKKKSYQKRIDSYISTEKTPSYSVPRTTENLDKKIASLPPAAAIKEKRQSPALHIPTDLTSVPTRKPAKE